MLCLEANEHAAVCFNLVGCWFWARIDFQCIGMCGTSIHFLAVFSVFWLFVLVWIKFLFPPILSNTSTLLLSSSLILSLPYRHGQTNRHNRNNSHMQQEN